MQRAIVGSVYSKYHIKLCAFARFPLKKITFEEQEPAMMYVCSLYILQICMFLLRYSYVRDCGGSTSVWELAIQMGSFLFPSLLPSW